MRFATCLALSLLTGCQPSGHEEDLRPGGAGGKADDPGACTPDQQLIDLVPAFEGRAFSAPVGLVPSPLGADSFYLVEKRGVIWRLTAGSSRVQLFADLRARVNARPGEAGLLGLAFSPQLASDGRVYLSYTAPSATSPANLRSRVSRMLTRDGGATLDPASEEILLAVDQPFENHNGGHIAFGPDRMLYIGLGDGGSAGDPGNRAQDLTTPLGKLLRIDVSGPAGHAVPADNPFAAGGGLGEIWAFGLRNPWRFSFDAATGELWLGDVGQDRFEEIDLVVRGGNYGWRLREGDHCFDPASGCPSTGLVAPVAEYGHDEGSSVTGGFVYRGAAIPALVGQYLFADFASGRFWALGEARRLVAETSLNVSSFAEGPDGELYAVDFSGQVFRVVGRACDGGGEADAGVADGGVPDAGQPDAGPAAPSFRDLYAEVIAPECGPCHTQGSSGGLSMPNATAAFQALLGIPARTSACTGSTRVVPGDAAASLLYRKVSGEMLCGPRMPLGGVLDADQIEMVRAWIEGGAAF